MAKQKRYYRYRVTEVGENFKDRLKVGDTTVDTWQGQSHSYQTINLDATADELPIEFAYSVELIDEVTEPGLLAKIVASRDPSPV